MESMELKDFVKKVTLDLVSATEEARNESTRLVHLIDSGDHRTIEFDIAVTVEREQGGSGKVGIQVWSFVEGKGQIAKQIRNSTVSRVKFGIHVDAQTKEEKQQHEAKIQRVVAENQRRSQIL